MALKVAISPENRNRLIKILRTVPSGGYAKMADRIIQSKWMKEMLAEAWRRGNAAGQSYVRRSWSDEPSAPEPINPWEN